VNATVLLPPGCDSGDGEQRGIVMASTNPAQVLSADARPVFSDRCVFLRLGNTAVVDAGAAHNCGASCDRTVGSRTDRFVPDADSGSSVSGRSATYGFSMASEKARH